MRCFNNTPIDRYMNSEVDRYYDELDRHNDFEVVKLRENRLLADEDDDGTIDAESD